MAAAAVAAAGAGAGAGAGSESLSDEENTAVGFLSSLSFEIDTSKRPISYLFESEDRQKRQLIVVIAKEPNGSMYWRQVFYKSSGTSSGIEGAWFPISAVIPGPAGFYKKDPVANEHFKEYDRLYNKSQIISDDNDIRVRIKTFSFLLAIRQLVSDEVFNALLTKLTNYRLKAAFNTLQNKVLSLIGSGSFGESGELTKSIPKEVTHLSSIGSSSYETINNWIGSDNYSGQLPFMRGLYGGGRRKRHTRKHRPHKRHTRRQRR
jgi:hypothetical protein